MTDRHKPISRFFADLGFALRNERNSWGAMTRDGVLLRVWEDGLDGDRVLVLGSPKELAKRALKSRGLPERVDHLRVLWSGGIAGYAVIARAKDPTADLRKIVWYDQQNVRAITALHGLPDGQVCAELGDKVPVSKLLRHTAGHRLLPAYGAFPAGHLEGRKASSSKPPAAYQTLLPEMRAFLVGLAKDKSTIGYEDFRTRYGLRSLTLTARNALERIGRDCVAAGEPILTSLIVDPLTQECPPGFERVFHRDDRAEREACFAFWSGGVAGNASLDAQEELRAKARTFALVEQRPDQGSFRAHVVMRWGGQCVVTKCETLEALDAAHQHGRDWRHQNTAYDGLLLRKDIHALYDRKLVEISEDGSIVRFSPKVAAYYRQYER